MIARGSTVRSAALVFALATAVGACSGGGGATAVLHPNPSNSFEQESRDDALPARFPRDFPLTSDRTVLYSAVSALGEAVYFRSPLAGRPLRTFLFDALIKAGWKMHSCALARTAPESVWLMVASKGGLVATVTVGYAPEFASRLGSERYTYFVSIANSAPTPNESATSCRESP